MSITTPDRTPGGRDQGSATLRRSAVADGDAPVIESSGLSDGDAARKSRFWRTVWRVHFYAGMLVLPVIVLLSITGTVILYGDNIMDRTDGNLRLVTPKSTARPLDDQVAAATAAFPGKPVQGITPAGLPDRSTKVVLLDGPPGGSEWDLETVEVYVDPYTATVLGSKTPGEDIPGLAEKIHGTLLVTTKVPVPTLAGLTGAAEERFEKVELGDLIIEIAACWAIILAVTGIYLWWPRKKRTGKALFVPRLDKAGRGRWRDLHAIPGVLFSLVLIFLVVTGLPWSGFWGSNWSHVSGEMLGSTNNNPKGVASTEAKAGDLNRFGNPVPWASEKVVVPASATPGAPHHPGAAATPEARAAAPGAGPQRLPLAEIERVAAAEGMAAGYSIALPKDTTKDGVTKYGTYALSNPSVKIQDRRTLFVDQFSGRPVVDHGIDDWGKVAAATSMGIDIHEGTQFGLINRIVMTLACLVILWSVFTGIVMWWKRRPQRTAGLPRRPADAHLERGLIILAVVLGLLFPLAGLTMIAVVILDRYVIRRVPRLRSAFGMR